MTALFVALGGTGYAAVTINGKNIKNHTIAGKKLKKHTVTAREVKSGSLLAQDFASGQLPAGGQGKKGDTGAPGAKGDTGAPGAKGDTGAPGVSDYERVSSASISNPNGSQRSGVVSCPAGKRVLGGGVVGSSGGTGQSLNSSFPLSDVTWKAYVNNTTGADASFSVYAICGVVQ